VIERINITGDVMYCSGGFLIEHPLIIPYLSKRIGDEDSIIGMPLKLTEQLLEEIS
jgi:septum formation protein